MIRRNMLCVVALAILAGIPGSVSGGSKITGSENVPDKAEIETIVAGNTEFALDLYASLKNEKGNLFFSPYSISTALTLTYSGAREETEKQMGLVLRFRRIKWGISDWSEKGPIKHFEGFTELPKERVHQSFAALQQVMNKPKEEYRLSIANALWAQKDYKFLSQFLDVTNKYYDAKVQELDFATETETARKTINRWVETKTNDKIKDLIKPGILNRLTRLVLTNAIYFKGLWELQFRKEFTEDAPFTVSPDKTVEVSMMHLTDDFKYWADDNLQILELPYKGNDLSMIVLLPHTVEGMESLEKSLSLTNLNNWLSKLRKQQVMVFLPRFKMTCEISLAETLAAMGMRDAFALPPADFSGMTGKKDLFISAVVHKAFVEVNEEGTEAAAATAVIMETLAAPGSPAPVFRADHPFIFLVKDNNSGSILFLGRLKSPKTQS
ncbi:MAG TPA: serpin family protein [Sedimentisphaerales bacterium]|nr:serpin family protein [Sedimentisphaerales bacterium]